MKLIFRYLLREYLAVLGYCLLAFASLLVVVDLFDHVGTFFEKKAPLAQIGLYYVFLLAASLEYLAPAALLLCTLYTLWQFTRHNEVTAMRMGGVGMVRVMLPFLLVGLAFTAAAGAIKETVTPRANRQMKEVLAKANSKSSFDVYDMAHYNSMGRRQWLIHKLDVRNPSRLYRVKVVCERPDGTRFQEIMAGEACFLDGQWWFRDVRIQEFDENENPVRLAPGAAPAAVRPLREMPFLDERPADFVNEIVNWDFLSGRAIYRYLQRHPDLSPRDRAQKWLTFHQRVALPWASFIVTLFAVPAGVRGGRRSALAGVFLTVSFFFGFYALMQVGTFLAMRQLVSPWLGAWLSNIVFLAVGTGLVARIR